MEENQMHFLADPVLSLLLTRSLTDNTLRVLPGLPAQ